MLITSSKVKLTVSNVVQVQKQVCSLQKMLSVLSEVKEASKTWMDILSEGINDAELEIFNSVLCRMEQKARELTGGAEDIK